MYSQFIIVFAAIIIYMSLWYVFSMVKGRVDYVDIAWGLGFIMVTWLSLYLSQNINFITVTVGILVSAWGLRLATHVYLRNKDKEEDYRYKKMREDWGKNFYLRS